MYAARYPKPILGIQVAQPMAMGSGHYIDHLRVQPTPATHAILTVWKAGESMYLRHF